MFLSLPVELLGSVLTLTLLFSLFCNVTKLEIYFCEIFFVLIEAVTLLFNDMFSLELLEWLVVVVHGFDFGSSL